MGVHRVSEPIFTEDGLAEVDGVKSSPCVGSGYCCMKSQCQLSTERHGYVKGACPELKWNGERHLCGLMLDDKGGDYAKFWLSEGAGCCSPLNSWRREPLRDRRRLPVL
jgi:hypothetical protein